MLRFLGWQEWDTTEQLNWTEPSAMRAYSYFTLIFNKHYAHGGGRTACSPMSPVSLCFWSFLPPWIYASLCHLLSPVKHKQKWFVSLPVEAFGSQYVIPQHIFSAVASMEACWYEGAVKLKQPGICWANTQWATALGIMQIFGGLCMSEK